MCGRTVCGLAPAGLCAACQYRTKTGEKSEPKWKNYSGPGGKTYTPGYNLAPETYGAVLVSGDKVEAEEERVIQPMKWGLIPSWHKGPPESFQYKMINARVEGLTEKASFRNALSKGQRCVILVDGFYEWKTEGKLKTPYFFHFPQETPVDFASGAPRRLLTMAGIFDISHPPQSEVPLYSYVVITVPSSEKVKFAHDRMPAILEEDSAVRDWLEAGRVSLKEALNLLQPSELLECYQVSPGVNNVQNKSPECVKPFAPQKTESAEKHKLQGTLLNYFKPDGDCKKRKELD